MPNSAIHSSRSAVVNVGLFVLLVTFATVAAGIGLSDVGAEYDELLGANAALGCPNPTLFLTYAKWIGDRCVPLMLMPYIGSLAALPLALVSTLQEVSIAHARLTTHLFVILASIVGSYAVRKRFGTSVSLVFLLFTLLDVQLFLTTRFDRPTAVPYVLRIALMCVLLWRPMANARNFRALCIGIIAGLLIWTKADAVFLLLSFCAGWTLTQKRSIRPKEQLPQVFALLIGTLLGALPFVLYLRRYWSTFFSVGESYASTSVTLAHKAETFVTQLVPREWYYYITLEQLQVHPFILASAGVIVLLWFAACIWSIRKDTQLSMYALAILCFAGLFLFYDGLRAAHHLVLLYPFVQLVVARYIITCAQWFRWLVIVLFIVVNSAVQVSAIGGMRSTCGQGSFTCAITPLAQSLSLQESVVTTDWGIATQLLFLSKGELRIHELSYDLAHGNRSELDALMENESGCVQLILRPVEQTMFAQARTTIEPLISNQTPSIIRDRLGTKRFELYRTCPPLPASVK